ncbi:MAG: flagellar assembly peptidoglycan hydrolase FlgJ [Gammaproteobacteria bacterium]|nr:flagellar assembly peptidoglycan hydrolase FlgJ [Gammaproteobacteria bacterium]
MPSIAPATLSYTDITGLVQDAKSLPTKKDGLEAAAKHFESVFINMWLKSARESNAAIASDDGMFGGKEMQMQQEMFDSQMAVHMAQNGGIGLAPVIVRQLRGDTTQISPTAPAVIPPVANTATVVPQNAIVKKDMAQTALAQTDPTQTGLAQTSDNRGIRTSVFSDAQAFLEEIGPRIARIAEQRGLPGVAMTAQAALETGWGSKIIQTLSGTLSHNLFGMKSNNTSEASIDIHSKEFVLGNWIDKMSSFKAYPDWDSSIRDYVDTLRDSSRYAKVLVTADPSRYVEALQDAGYATDPKYAAKLKDVIQRISSMDF